MRENNPNKKVLFLSFHLTGNCLTAATEENTDVSHRLLTSLFHFFQSNVHFFTQTMSSLWVLLKNLTKYSASHRFELKIPHVLDRWLNVLKAADIEFKQTEHVQQHKRDNFTINTEKLNKDFPFWTPEFIHAHVLLWPQLSVSLRNPKLKGSHVTVQLSRVRTRRAAVDRHARNQVQVPMMSHDFVTLL